ncbi:MAG TPA: hypothetical protein PLP19_17620 [bacterium]|nr:hypothetical protein [bacterium]HPN45314.1 hypothetical protein [bacterium]
MIKKGLITLLLLTPILLECAAHTNLQPVGKNRMTAHGSIGGPIVKAFGTRLPVPYATTGCNYGITDNLDLNGSLHLLPLAYGLFGGEYGATWYPLLNSGLVPTVGIQGRLLTLISLKSGIDDRFRIYPVLTGSAAWQCGAGLAYTGLDTTMPLTRADYDADAEKFIFSPFIGYKWKLGRQTWLYTELKWNGANIQTEQLAVEYLPVSKHGAVTTLFSIERSFK